MVNRIYLSIVIVSILFLLWYSQYIQAINFCSYNMYATIDNNNDNDDNGDSDDDDDDDENDDDDDAMTTTTTTTIMENEITVTINN